MNSPLTISVVIPAYNAEQTLPAALQSVMGQAQQPREVIVVDDGSSDNTATVAKSYRDRVRLIQQENQGSAVARQVGTEAATSDFVAYLDADDWWHDETLSNFHEVLEADPVHFVIADFVRAIPGAQVEQHFPRNTSFFPWFEDHLQEFGERLNPERLTRLPVPWGLEALLLGFPYFPSASLLRRDSVFRAGGWDHRFRRCQDFDLALRIARLFPLHFFDEVQAIVGINEGNRDVEAYVVQQTEGDIRVLEAHRTKYSEDPEYRRKVSRTLARRYYSLGNVFRKAGNRSAARKAYWSAFRWPGKRSRSFVRLLGVGF